MKHASVIALIPVALALVACGDDNPSPGSGSSGAYPGASQLCVDKTNQLRASAGSAPLTRNDAKEACTDGEAASDAASGKPHGAFPGCGEAAQNECPGWSGTPESVAESCVQAFFNEGPGQDYNTHGHYINLTSTKYSLVSCGFYATNGKVWLVENFY